MKTQLVAFLLGLNSFVAYAGPAFTTEKTVFCADTKTVIESISGPDWNEEPIWTAPGETNSKYVLTVNSKTNSWSIIQYNDKIACVLGSGADSNLINFQKSRIKTNQSF